MQRGLNKVPRAGDRGRGNQCTVGETARDVTGAYSLEKDSDGN